MKQNVGILLSATNLKACLAGKKTYEVLALYEKYAQEHAMHPVFFSLYDIDFDRLLVNVASRRGYHYVRHTVPLPSVIHNRTRLSPRYDGLLKRLLAVPQTDVFNGSNYFNKWHVYRTLCTSRELCPHLPQTSRLTPENVERMLKEYAAVYVKPFAKSLGQGIVKCMLLNDENVQLSWQKSGAIHERVLPQEDVLALLQKKCGSRYVIQRAVPLIQLAERPVDFRVSVQKGVDGKWGLSGIVARRGIAQAIVTNVAAGGTCCRALPVLEQLFPKRAVGIYEQMGQLGIRIATHLAQGDRRCADLGLDLAVDEKGHIWFLEVNGRDLRITFRHAAEWEMWHNTFRRPLAYASFLLQQQLQTRAGAARAASSKSTVIGELSGGDGPCTSGQAAAASDEQRMSDEWQTSKEQRNGDEKRISVERRTGNWKCTDEERCTGDKRRSNVERRIGGERRARDVGEEMAVTILTPGAFPVPAGRGGSVETVATRLAEQLFARGIHVQTVGTSDVPGHEGGAAHEDDSAHEDGTANGSPIGLIRVPRKANYLLHAIGQMRRFPTSIVQVENRPKYVPALRRAFPHARIILSLHSLTYCRPAVLSPRQLQRIFAACDRVVANSRFLQRELQKLAPRYERIVTHIHLGVAQDTFRPIDETQTERQAERRRLRKTLSLANEPTVLFVGRLIPQKGVHRLIAAMERVLVQVPNVMLVVVGGSFYGRNTVTPYVHKLKQMAEKLNGRIRWVPFVSAEDIHHYYTVADVVVTPSLGSEAFGLVNVEAMASGLPVITYDRGGISEVVVHGESGYVLPARSSVGQLAERIAALLTDGTLRKRLGMAGRQRTLDMFTWERVAADYEQLYRDVLQHAADRKCASASIS